MLLSIQALTESTERVEKTKSAEECGVSIITLNNFAEYLVKGNKKHLTSGPEFWLKWGILIGANAK